MKSDLHTFNIDKIETLEEYLMHLGCFCISMNSMSKMHETAIKAGIFQGDETENAKNIIYQVLRMMTIANDQIKLCCSRTEKPWDEILKSIQGLVPKNKTNASQGKRKGK